MPHGYCYLWDPRLVWLHVISDGLITFSYYCIPVVLIYFIRKRRDLPFNWIFWMFGGFILACGTTHLMEVWNVWHASYLLAGVLKAITATLSVATLVLLIPLLPQAIALPNLMHLQEKNRKLEGEIARHRRLDDALVDAVLRRHNRSNPRLVKRLSGLASAASLFSIAVGGLALLGWVLHIEALKTWAAGPSTVKVNSAISFILIGVSLALLRDDCVPIAWVRKLTGRAMAALAMLLGLGNAVEYVFDFSLGIDHWWSAAPAGEKIGRAGPQLMSPITSLDFLLLGLALLMLDWRTRRGREPGQILSLMAAGASTLGVLNFLLDPNISPRYISLSIPTAVTFAVFSFGLLCARTKWGLGAFLVDPSLAELCCVNWSPPPSSFPW